MTCVHLRRLYQICQQEGLKLSAPDLIHIVCPQCGEKEVCPSMLIEEVEASEAAEGSAKSDPSPGDASPNDRFSA